MERMFNPESIVIFGLSIKKNNVPRLILENLLRWGYKGRIFGVHPGAREREVYGISMYSSVKDLPLVPDLAVLLIPARYVPETVKSCADFGIKRLCLMSGGFNELGEEGQLLADKALAFARESNMRFIGPNCLALANTANGLCLPFIPILKPPSGGFSLISQSGGLGIFQWSQLRNENIGLAKFASIGNKLDINEVEVLEYLGKDPDTKLIAMYLESILDGRALIEAAEKIDKPILIYKASVTKAGEKAAMSHTAALASDESVMDSAFREAGIIRIHNFNDFLNVAKAFELPPFRGNKIMAMSPIGGGGVIMADNCERYGFEMADPGEAFYKDMQEKANAGIINFSNPLDLGDIYDMSQYSSIFHGVMHSPEVDGAIYFSQWPDMPEKEERDIFTGLFHTDISNEVIGSVRSSGKPFGAVILGAAPTIDKIKTRLPYPIFDSPEAVIRSFAMQRDYYAKNLERKNRPKEDLTVKVPGVKEKLLKFSGDIGEEFFEILEAYSIPLPLNKVATSPEEALIIAEEISYPLVLKVASPDALHKSDIGGVKVNIKNKEELLEGFEEIKNSLFKHIPNARFEGVRIMQMAEEGHDMFVGINKDPSFGPVVFFGYGGVFVEIFKDVDNLLCPARPSSIKERLSKLKSYALLKGARGALSVDTDRFVDIVARLSSLAANHPEIIELDLNPLRILKNGEVLALDVRARVSH